MKPVLISDSECAQILEISKDRLYEICDIFDADPEDPWDLIEGKHFEYGGRYGEIRRRRFTEKGVEVLAGYVGQTRPMLRRVRDWFQRRAHTVRRRLVRTSITEVMQANVTMITVIGGRAYMPHTMGIRILRTNGRGWHGSLRRIQGGSLDEAEPLQAGVDFTVDDDTGELLYSSSGVGRIALDMSKHLKGTKDRRLYLKAVSDVVEECTEAQVKLLLPSGAVTSPHMKRALVASGYTCAITGKRQTPSNPIALNVHHLFDKSTYPELAIMQDNLLVISEELHQEFHSWHRGPCEPKHLLEFLTHVRVDLFDENNKRSQKRLAHLTHQLTIVQRRLKG